MYVFEAKLENWPGVGRTVVVRGDQTLVDLHEVLREAFEWWDDHLYSYWLSGKFWDGPETEYSSPVELEDTEAKSAEARVDSLGLEAGQRIAYLFDYGDQWRVDLNLAEIRPAGDEPYAQILERPGEAPPQYEPVDEEELDTGD